MPRCPDCEGSYIVWHQVLDFSMGFCMHCGRQAVLGAPKFMVRNILAKMRRDQLDMEMAIAREQYQEAIYTSALKPNADPMHILEAIREQTYLIAIEGYGEDTQEVLNELVKKLEGDE